MEQKKKVFVIEDDAIITSSLAAKLNLAGCEAFNCLDCSDESSIIKEITHQQPDYVLLDLILPSLDGFALLSTIKSTPGLSVTPVFVFADMSEADWRARADRLGADYYFLKTDFNLDNFISRFKNIIKNI